MTGKGSAQQGVGETVPLHTTEDPSDGIQACTGGLCLVEPVESDDPDLVRFSSGVVFFPFRWPLGKKHWQTAPSSAWACRVLSQALLEKCTRFLRDPACGGARLQE